MNNPYRVPLVVVDDPSIGGLKSKVSMPKVEDHNGLAVAEEEGDKIDSAIVSRVVDQTIAGTGPHRHRNVVTREGGEWGKFGNTVRTQV